MYVYIQSEPGLWTVGFYDPSGKWQPESDHDTKEQAADRVHWLHGGISPKYKKDDGIIFGLPKFLAIRAKEIKDTQGELYAVKYLKDMGRPEYLKALHEIVKRL